MKLLLAPFVVLLVDWLLSYVVRFTRRGNPWSGM